MKPYETTINEVLDFNFESLITVEDVVQAIGYLTGKHRYIIPTEVIKDIDYRLSCQQEDVAYAKQQLLYLVRWIKRGV